MNINKKGHIRYLHKNSGQSISAIARELSLSRKTVRNALKEEKETIKKQRISKLDTFKEQIERILTDNPGITNTLILEKIRKQGYDGGKTILGDYLIKGRVRTKKAYLNIETLPAMQAQVDWAECGAISVGTDGHKRKLYIFCMLLSYSRYFYLEPVVSMHSDVFLSCHINAFKFFGGIPKTILYDNLKSVVQSRIGREIVFNPRALDFAYFYGYKIKVCNVRAPQEKGKVERAIRYIKNNFMQREKYQNYEIIKGEASLWLTNIAAKRKHSQTGKIVLDCFKKEEKSHLLPLPDNHYDYAAPKPVSLRKDCLFQFDCNRYSVPTEFYGKALVLKAYTEEIKVFHSENLVCRHRRCYDKYQTIKNLKHYEKQTAQKKSYENQAQIERFKKLCPEAEIYLKGLIHNQTKTVYHIKQILSLETVFGKTAVCSAIVKALRYKAFHWEYIKNILIAANRIQKQIKITLPDKKRLLDMDIAEVDLSQYDRLISEKYETHNRGTR